MPNVKLENKTDLNATIVVELKPEDYKEKVSQKLKSIRKGANIKGFRMGHAPMGMIKRLHGQNVLVDEVNNAASSSLYEFIQSEKLDILAQPLASKETKSELNFDKEDADFKYAFDVAFAPEFDLNISTKDKLTRYVIEVSDEDLNKEMENIRKRQGKLVEVDKSIDTDIIYAKATELGDSGKPLEGGLEAKEISFVSDLVKNKKEQKKVLGLTKGDKVTVNIFQLFNENETVISNTLGITKEEAQDLNPDFELEITEVKRNELAELNQELFDQVMGKGVVKSEEEFKAKTKENLEIYYKSEAENHLEFEVDELIKKKHKITMPDEFLKRWLLETKSEEYNEDNIDERYEQESLGLLYVLVQEKMAKEYEFQVSKEDIEQTSLGYTAQMFRQYGMNNPEFSMIEEFSNNQLKDANYVQRMNDIALRRKMTDKVKELVTIKEKKIAVEKFYKEINDIRTKATQK
jgi:trigger factor